MAGWAPTKRSLHLCAQMLGKLRVELSPRQPNWMFTLLHLDARGLTTGAMPYDGTSVEGLLDVFASEIILRRSTGDERHIALVPPRTIADVYAAIHAALAELDVACTLWPIPQEIPDITALDEDTRPAAYDPVAVRRWFAATTSVAGVFDQWREHFFGRSGVQLWWGAFDIAVMLFNGRHAPAPLDRGYLMKYDLDAELMNVGLYYGDEKTPPFFYGYIFPQPPGAETFAMAPAGVTWSPALKEWVLPYDTVRLAADPDAELRAFLDAVYARCISDGGWDRAALSYDAPRKLVRDA